MNENQKKLNNQQKDSLVYFMQENYRLLYGKFGNSEGKSSKEDKWQEITEVLNALGPEKSCKKNKLNC